jgi:cytosine/adenosine deaminase-related metal-dependent hydrolase
MIQDGAIYQENGQIVEVGKYQTLRKKYQSSEILGNDTDLVIPGFVNAHHHIGITPFQRGVKDNPLEIWAVSMMGARGVDPYLDTLYSAFEMIESGVTTVQHLHGWLPGPIEQISESASETLRAYRDIGMRVSYSYCVRDQNYLAYEGEEDFLRTLPPKVAQIVEAEIAAHASVPLHEYLNLFEDLYHKYIDSGLIRIQLAPANLHWCSDEALTQLQALAEEYRVPLHMHLLETLYQKEYARRRGGISAVRYLQERGMLGPHMTLGHGTWVTEEDIDLLAETRTRICHNCSSNLCLRSGIMPLNHYRKRGVKVAIGIDGAGINDDRDMLQEMRLVLHSHRVPGMREEDVPDANEIFRMATENGAMTTPYGDQIGTLEVGKRADLVILNWQRLAFPYLDESVPVVDAILHRGKSQAVETVIIDGEVVVSQGRYSRLNKQDVLMELSQSLKLSFSSTDAQRRNAIEYTASTLRNFYQNYASRSLDDWMLN